MKIKLDFENHVCIVTREDGDPKFRRSGWALPESTFLYHVQQELKKQGYDVIKKRMWKDGHMVDDTQQYVRTRRWGSDPLGNTEFAIYNTCYAVYDAGEEFDIYGEVNLGLI